MYFDGSLNIDGAGAGVYFISPSRDRLSYVLRIHFKASNNVVEYEAALHGLRIAVELNIKRLMVFGDSALVINLVNKDWDYTSEWMDAYCAQIRKLENKFYGLEFHHVVRADNEAADKLSKLGSTRATIPHGVFVYDLVKPSIEVEGKPMAEQPSVDQLVTVILTTGTD
jgi:ribonuclease HI